MHLLEPYISLSEGSFELSVYPEQLWCLSDPENSVSALFLSVVLSPVLLWAVAGQDVLLKRIHRYPGDFPGVSGQAELPGFHLPADPSVTDPFFPLPAIEESPAAAALTLLPGFPESSVGILPGKRNRLPVVL